MSEFNRGNLAGSRTEHGWLRPETEDNDLRRYLTTLRERRVLIVVCVVIATLVAAAYVNLAKPVYQAQANMLVMPVNVTSGDQTLTGLPLVMASSDPTLDVETAAELVKTTNVAAATKAALNLSGTSQQILSRVSVTPVAGSDIVAVTATGPTAGAAARLANTFAASAIALRTAAFDQQLDQEIAALDHRIAASPATVAAQLATQLTELETLRAGSLPDMRLDTTAEPPTSPSSPRKALSIGAGLAVGLMIGIIAAFALQAVDPRLRREEQLRRLFQLPILARVPREGPALGGLTRAIDRLPFVGDFARRRQDRRTRPRTPAKLSPASLEAYRTLRATLLAWPGGSPRSILVTGSAQWEGKTTTAINLAASLALSGASVILIEADVRQPSIGIALGLDPILDLKRVLSGEVNVEEALVESDEYGPNLRVLLARGWFGEPSALHGDELLLPAASGLLSNAERLADFVVIDSPPLAEVIDALELARQADAVLLVARLGQTQVTRLRRLGALLARTDVDPIGLVLIGTEPPRASDTYGYIGAGVAEHSAPPGSATPRSATPRSATPGSATPARRLRASGKTRSSAH